MTCYFLLESPRNLISDFKGNSDKTAIHGTITLHNYVFVDTGRMFARKTKLHLSHIDFTSGNYTKYKIYLFHVEAKCSDVTLQQTATDIKEILNNTVTSRVIIATAKANIRKILDCHVNVDIRSQLFDHYEALCRRNVILKNTYDDFFIKLNVIQAEQNRCKERSKLLSIIS